MSVFLEKSHPPNDLDLSNALGPSKRCWDEIIRAIQLEYPPIVFEWKHSGAKYGWSLRLLQKKHRILYLIPEKDHFLTAFILSDRSVAAALKSDLPRDVQEIIRSARKYPEGTGFRLEIRTAADVGVVRKLAALKMRPE